MSRFGMTSTKVLFSTEQEDDIETAERDLFEAEEAKKRDDAQLDFNEMEKGQYNAKRNDYDEMRARLRNRAGSMEMQQSMETEEAIKQAANRAANKVDPSDTLTPSPLDLSKINGGIPKKKEDDNDMFDEDFSDFTDEMKANYDPTGEMSYIEQFQTEMAGVKWPTPGAVARQFVVALVTLAFMIWFIISLDTLIRTNFMEFGLYPKPEDTMAEIERLGLGK